MATSRLTAAIVAVLALAPVGCGKNAAVSATEGAERTPAGKPQGQEAPEVRYMNPAALARSPRFTHAVQVERGKLVFLSGQAALDGSGAVVGPGDLRAQTTRAFENLGIALAEVGATFDNVVKLNSYLVDVSRIDDYRQVRERFFASSPNRPASTTVEVKGLTRPELLIEIDAIAVVP